MKFNKFIEDRNHLVKELLEQKAEKQINDDPVSLAYLGDAWFSLYVREQIMGTIYQKVRILQAVESELVSAKYQAYAWFGLENEWSVEERVWFKRGRNASPSRGRGAGHYKISTGYETVLGYLYQSGHRDRLLEMANKSFVIMLEHFYNEQCLSKEDENG